MNAPDLLAELGRAFGLPHLELSGLGTASLIIDGELTLNLEHMADAGLLMAYLSLGQAPADGREACFAQLLAASLFGRDSGGGTIGLDLASDEIVLSRSFVLEHTDALALEAGLAALVDAARHRRTALASIPVQAHPPIPSDAAAFVLPFGALLRA